MTLVPTLPSGSRFPSSEDWLSISTLLKQVSLRPCCVFAPVLLTLSQDRTQAAFKHLETPQLGHGLLGIATLISPARVSLQGIFIFWFDEFLLFLVVHDGGQVALGGFVTDECFSYKL